jgi:predicted MFS family arabinose efflux permease
MSMGVSSGWYRIVQPDISVRHLSQGMSIAIAMDDEAQIFTRKVSRMIHRILFNARKISPLRLTLLSTVLFDELITGFPVVGLPLLRDQLGLSYGQIGLLFSVEALSGMILSPIISLLSDRGTKRWWVIGGSLGLAISLVLMGSTHNFGLLLAAFAFSSPAGSAAVGLSQAALIDAAPQESAQTMTRWTLMGSVGDLLSPLAVAAIASLHLGWPALCWLGVAIWSGAALVLGLQHFPRPTDVVNDTGAATNVKLLAGLREALRDPVLLRWAVLSLIPTMMDEVFLGFVALYLRDVLHASQVVIGVVLTISMMGTLLGLFTLDLVIRKCRISPTRLLSWLALLSLVGVIGFLITRSIWLATVALFVIHLGVAGWYPIVQAQAYDRQPGRSGTVRAVIGLGAPFEVALPGIVGIIAGHFGALAGVGLLGLAPVLILLLVARGGKTEC